MRNDIQYPEEVRMQAVARAVRKMEKARETASAKAENAMTEILHRHANDRGNSGKSRSGKGGNHA